MALRYERQDGIAELVIAGEVTVHEIVAHLEDIGAAREPVPLLINVAGSAVLPKSVDLRPFADRDQAVDWLTSRGG